MGKRKITQTEDIERALLQKKALGHSFGFDFIPGGTYWRYRRWDETNYFLSVFPPRQLDEESRKKMAESDIFTDCRLECGLEVTGISATGVRSVILDNPTSN